MKKVHLEIIVEVSFLSKVKSESKMVDILNEANYNFSGEEGFTVENTEMIGIEKTGKNQAQATFKVIVSVNEGLDIENDVVNEMDYDVTAPEIIDTEMTDFTVICSK